MISEIGGVSKFDDDNALAKFSGLYWSEYQSADFKAEDTYLKRTGNEYLRYYFIQAADQLRKYCPEFSQYYARKFKESKTRKHKRALVLTTRKAVRLVFALLCEEKLSESPATSLVKFNEFRSIISSNLIFFTRDTPFMFFGFSQSILSQGLSLVFFP